LSVSTYTAVVQGGPKTGPFLNVYNFAMVNSRKACERCDVKSLQILSRKKCKTCTAVCL